MNEFYTRQETAKKLQMSVKTVDRMIKNYGEDPLPSFKIGNKVLIAKHLFEHWFNRRCSTYVHQQ